MKRPLILSFVAAATLLCAGAARANDVHWSIGINLPPVGTVISNGPFYGPPVPVYIPAPVRYAPPVVYGPAPVFYDAPPVFYDAPPVVYRVQRPYYGYPTRYERPAVVFRGDGGRWDAPRRDRDYRGERVDWRDHHHRGDRDHRRGGEDDDGE